MKGGLRGRVVRGNLPWASILVVATSVLVAVGAVATVQPTAGGPAAAGAGPLGLGPGALAAWLGGAGSDPLGEFVIEGEHAHSAMGFAGDWVSGQGPRSPGELLAACPQKDEACLLRELALVMETHGPEASFQLLEDTGDLDPTVVGQGHPLAHELGRHALMLYGTIQDTMGLCSYEVFAGCFHGALQAHFESLGTVDASSVQGLCPEDNPFRQYTCLHGAGHGLFLATRHDLKRSLELCDALPTVFGRGSCHGGAIMENVVGYFDSLAGAHHHGPEGEVQPYLVDAARPTYPCDSLAAHHQHSCWLMQTSLVLHFNQGDFAATARVCQGLAAEHVETCYRSLGRDAAPYTNRDPARMIIHCANAHDEAGVTACTQGFVAESVLQFNNPEAGLRLCRAIAEPQKLPCYREVGWQARGMVDAATLARLCDTAETPAQAAECKSFAGVPA